MTSTQIANSLAASVRLAAEAERLAGAAITRAAELTGGGARIDDHQVLCERLATMATEARAASALVEYAQRLASSGRSDALAEDEAFAYSAEVLHRMVAGRDARPDDFAGLLPLSDDALELLREGLADARIREIGARTIESRGATNVELDDGDATQTRAFTRQFARSEVLKEEDGVALADRIHREDLLVPETLIKQYSELGFFGSSIPEEFGGTGMGYLTMTVLTEELSTASLVAGSLLTRSEILCRALLEGGTEAQRRAWLPRIASGDVIVAFSGTEPDIGSDVASVQCRAVPGNVGGHEGWLINGQKAWCTFAGRASVLALLARTDPDARTNAKLSLFIVEKDVSYAHQFECRQPHGGVLTGEAIATPGYRGMHSYILNLDNYFVPAENLVGEERGQGRGLHLTLGGIQVSRLQTGGRACGVAQAAIEKACHYVSQRTQFGKAIGDYQLTQYKLGLMAMRIAAARQLTYRVARTLSHDQKAPLEPAMCKLYASDVAVWVTQEAQLLHGGWGYAEEDRITRYVADAQVLPIFEGVKPILELKVIARALLAQEQA